MNRRFLRSVVLAVAALELLTSSALVPAAGKRRLFKTAPPPKFDKKDTEVFFDNALEKLGPGEPGGKQTAAAAPAATANGDEEGPSGGGDGFAWSKLIAASTIEDVVKGQVAPIEEMTKTPGSFKSGGNHECRMRYSVLAMLFSVISQYDGDVRWKKDAVGLRAAFGHVANNCKVGTDASFKEAKLRSEELGELIKGGKVSPPKAEGDFNWAETVNRPALMMRMGKEGYNTALKSWTADHGEFSKNRNALAEEAQLLAVVAQVIQDPSYEFGDDETYLGYAKELGVRAQEVADAAKADNFQKAQTAAGLVNKACSKCHEDYRSGG